MFQPDLSDVLPPNYQVVYQTGPALTIPFAMLPSKNDALALAGGRAGTSGLNREWRERARLRALETVLPLGLPIQFYRHSRKKRTAKGTTETISWLEGLVAPMFERVALKLEVWRPDNAIWDVTNPWIGPIIDGFVDARILIADDCFHLPSYSVEFMGVDASLKFTPQERAQRKVRKETKKNTLALKRARYLFQFYPLAQA